MKILQKLKKYLKDNSEEQILADWKKTKNSDCINAPSVDEFLLYNVGKRSELFYCFNKQNKKLDKCIKQCSTCKEMKLMQ